MTHATDTDPRVERVVRRLEGISSLPTLPSVAMGMNQIRSLVIGINVLKAFGPGRSAQFSHEAFWEHCTGTGALCRMLARRFGLSLDGEEYVAGLTHDIGRLTLYQYLNDEFSRALAEATERRGLTQALGGESGDMEPPAFVEHLEADIESARGFAEIL
jgi:HD-like signal output (HDOD) protein